MKRIQQQFVEGQKDLPKKRKIQTIFLGALGDEAVTSQASILNPLSSSYNCQQKQQEKLSTLRVNPILIGRVIGNEQQIINEQQRCEKLPVKTEDTINEVEILEEHSLMNNSSSLIMMSENTNSHKQDEQRPLPELKLQSNAKLTPFPKIADLFNNVNVDCNLQTPTSQKTLEITIPMGAQIQTDQLIIKNVLNNKRGIKYAKIQAKFGHELKWVQIFDSPLLLIQANIRWTVSTHEDNTLAVYCTQTGRLCFTLHTDSPITNVEIRDDICLALNTLAELTTWDLKKSTRILHTSLRTLLIRPKQETLQLQIVRLCLSANGLPILVLNNGDMAIYSRTLASWLFLNINRDFLRAHLPSMLSISQSLPDGLISLLLDVLNRGKLEIPSPTTSSIQYSEEMQSINEESQLELLLRAVFELEAIEEYRLLVAIYMQKLVKKGKFDKMSEFFEELRVNPNVPSMFTDTILADIRPLLQSHGLSNSLLRFDHCSNEQRRERELEASLNFIFS